ncbi:MAG: hypothetical protein IT285_12955 [Bdellovibrionales bacterium]|nr:hypothetical protein [Bdellovibrionales bacterium]
MDPMFPYVAVWSFACALGGLIALLRRRNLVSDYLGYFRFLLRPWRIASFLLAWITLAVVGRYARDPTWDDITSTFMALLTFTTAPWAVGVLYRGLAGVERKSYSLFLAFVAWQFSASWSYDGYLLIRDGFYPPTWWSNLLASGLIYLGGGLMWNLTQTPKSVTFAFTQTKWFHETDLRISRIFWFALPFALFFAKVMAEFIL